MAAPGAPRSPHPALRAFVTAYVAYDYVAPVGSVHHGLPSTELTVVLALDQPLDVGWMRDPGSRGRYPAVASGLHAAPALIHQGGREQGIQFGLTPPGCRALLGMPAGGLAGTMVPLGDLLPEAGRLYDAVAGAGTWPARFDELDRLLLGLCDADRASARPEVTRAWARLHASGGGVRVQESGLRVRRPGAHDTRVAGPGGLRADAVAAGGAPIRPRPRHRGRGRVSA